MTRRAACPLESVAEEEVVVEVWAPPGSLFVLVGSFWEEEGFLVCDVPVEAAEAEVETPVGDTVELNVVDAAASGAEEAGASFVWQPVSTVAASVVLSMSTDNLLTMIWERIAITAFLYDKCITNMHSCSGPNYSTASVKLQL